MKQSYKKYWTLRCPSSENTGLLCSRSRSQRTFKIRIGICPDSNYLHNHKPECRDKKNNIYIYFFNGVAIFKVMVKFGVAIFKVMVKLGFIFMVKVTVKAYIIKR